MHTDNKIENSIVPIRMAELIAYIARRKKLSATDAMCYFYGSSMAGMLYDEKAKWWYLDNETLYNQMESERKKEQEELSPRELQFVVFCIEAYARRNKLSSLQAFALFKTKNLITFLKNNFEVLHTQGEEYILDEVKLYLKRRKNA